MSSLDSGAPADSPAVGHASAYRFAIAIATIALAAVGSGCISVGGDGYGYEPMCETSTDCDPGESCDEGICWGNPPSRSFAAVLMPPEGRPDLAPTEIPELDIAADGMVSNLRFARTATIAGRVVLACHAGASLTECDPGATIAAQIHVSAPSAIRGRPRFARSTTSTPGADGSAPSFTLTLPASSEPYEVTVVPTRVGASAASTDPRSAIELAPPIRFSLVAESDMEVTWIVGDPAHYVDVRGRVVDAVGAGMPDMQVFAVAEGQPAAVLERTSSLATTGPDGSFSLRVPATSEAPVDLVAMPLQEGSAPTLRVSRVWIADSPLDLGREPVELPVPLRMPSYGVPRPYVIPIQGIDGSGNVVPVGGAKVRITTYLPGLDPDAMGTFSTFAFTDHAGRAQVSLIPGSQIENRRYFASVDPQAGVPHAAIHDHVIDIGAEQGGLLASINLGRRVAVGGVLRTAAGEPAAGTTVQASLAASFRRELAAESLPAVDNLQLASERADASGRFLLWLDGRLAGATATYDLELSPADTLAPIWSVRDVDMGRRNRNGSVELDVIAFPDASYARGTVTAADGAPVHGAELRLYELGADVLCPMQQLSGSSECAPPPIFRGLWFSRNDGQVMVVLPHVK